MCPGDHPALGSEVRPGARAGGCAGGAPQPGDVWHPGEVRVVIRGRVHWLWRAVDQHGAVLDEILQRRRDKQAARRLLVRLLKRQGWRPRRIVTDKLASYAAAKREVAPTLEHRAHKGLNNRAENSHVPFRKRGAADAGLPLVGGLPALRLGLLRPRATCSSRPPVVAPPSPPASIASKRSTSGARSRGLAA